MTSGVLCTYYLRFLCLGRACLYQILEFTSALSQKVLHLGYVFFSTRLDSWMSLRPNWHLLAVCLLRMLCHKDLGREWFFIPGAYWCGLSLASARQTLPTILYVLFCGFWALVRLSLAMQGSRTFRSCPVSMLCRFTSAVRIKADAVAEFASDPTHVRYPFCELIRGSGERQVVDQLSCYRHSRSALLHALVK